MYLIRYTSLYTEDDWSVHECIHVVYTVYYICPNVCTCKKHVICKFV